MFLAVLVVALVVFTGVTVRAAALGVGRASRWAVAVAQGGQFGRQPAEESEEDEPTDPFGRAVAAVEPEAPVVSEPVLAETTADEEEPPPDVADGGAEPAPPALRPSGDAPLELRLGPSVGEWRLPPADLLKRAGKQVVDEHDADAGGTALVAALAAHGVETRLVGRTDRAVGHPVRDRARARRQGRRG